MEWDSGNLKPTRQYSGSGQSIEAGRRVGLRVSGHCGMPGAGRPPAAALPCCPHYHPACRKESLPFGPQDYSQPGRNDKTAASKAASTSNNQSPHRIEKTVW